MVLEKDFSSPAYHRARTSYIVFAMFEYFVYLLISDAFLAKLLSAVGFKDSEIGVLSSLLSLAFVFQLLSLLLARTRGSKKTMIITLNTLGQMLFFALYILPLIDMDATLRRALMYVFIIGGYMCKYLVSTFLFHWVNSFVHPNRRASHSANMEIVSLVGGILFSLSMGAAFSWFEGTNNLTGGFLFLAIVVLLSNLFCFVCLICIKRDRTESAEQLPNKKLGDIFVNTFGNKNFRRLVVVAILWKSAQYFTIGFMGTFKTDTLGNGLAMSIQTVQIITMIGSIAQMPATRLFGRYSDKRSFAAGFYLSMYIGIAAFLCTVFTTEKTWFLVIAYTVLYAICLSGNGQNSWNMTYSYVNSDYIAEAMALQNCISGVCGFGCSLLAGELLDGIQKSGNVFCGIPMFGQQLLGLISALLCVVCIVYMRLTIMREKVIKQ